MARHETLVESWLANVSIGLPIIDLTGFQVSPSMGRA